MKRKSALYVVNFLLPVLFFLCLDFASLLMPIGGDKISFKITVLLAVTVMQLILIEILPFTSSRIPLIGKNLTSLQVTCSDLQSFPTHQIFPHLVMSHTLMFNVINKYVHNCDSFQNFKHAQL